MSCLLCGLLLVACSDIFEEDISRKKVEVMAPGAGWVLKGAEQVFVWKPMEGASAYRLVVVSPSFARIELYVADTTVTGNHWKTALPAGTYEWSLRGCNSAYESQDTVLAFSVRPGQKGGNGNEK